MQVSKVGQSGESNLTVASNLGVWLYPAIPKTRLVSIRNQRQSEQPNPAKSNKPDQEQHS